MNQRSRQSRCRSGRLTPSALSTQVISVVKNSVRPALIVTLSLAQAAIGLAQTTPRLDALVAALRPALPFPAAAPDGATPAAGGADFKWFVVWPSDPADTSVVVKANPFHPDTQKAGATAEGPIQAAVVQAERKAQAAYERAVDELKRTGKISAGLTGISLEDEGIAGEKIDAELELTIDLEPGARSFEITSSQPPVVAAGTTGMTWLVTTPANAYRDASGSDTREHFRAAEARLYFGALARPTVSKRDDRPRFSVALTPTPDTFTVMIRGNEALLKTLLTVVDWSPVARANP